MVNVKFSLVTEVQSGYYLNEEALKPADLAADA